MKPDLKGFWKRKKKWILGITAGVAAVAAGLGAWYYVGHSNAEPVYVFPFQFVGMTEYWGDSQESYGPVSSDNIQTVFVSDTQTVTEVCVKEGDTVKKGDLLITYDTTLTDLALERARLDVEKLKLQLEDAKRELRRINGLKPMVIPEVEEEDDSDADLGKELTKPYKISTKREYDGSSADKALICWIRSDTALNDALFDAIREKAVTYQTENAPDPTDPAETEPEETERKVYKPDKTRPVEVPSDKKSGSGSSTEAELLKPLVNVRTFHVVFKVTQGNMSLGEKTLWQGMKISMVNSGYDVRFTTAVVPDHMMAALEFEEEEGPEIDYGSGYTAAQIAQMRTEQQKVIKDLEFDVKMAEAEYKIKKREVDDGGVRSLVDGTVVSVLTPEEAMASQQPMVKVSGGGGFYIEGSVSELEKDKLKIGQEVTVNDWNTGMVYTGTVDSVGDFPNQEAYWSGMGNPTTSYYPFRVFVDGTADLQTGQYVSIMYSTSESGHGVYLQNPFLRTEQGRSYVYILGAGGKLEQRFVTTGKALWGSYTEILSGLTAEDLVAFPYGKNVKPGAPAQEGDMSNLYE